MSSVVNSLGTGGAESCSDPFGRVVNVKVAFLRPKYANLQAWMEDPENVYVGRAGVVFVDGKRFPPKASEFANPFKIGKDGNREEVIAKYRAMVEEKIAIDPGFRERLKALKGKRLGCWCAPEPCHGDVLMELANAL